MSVTTTTRFKQHVTSSPGVCGGRPCIAGTRIRVSDVAALAQSGHSPDEILANFPRLKLADVHAALAYYYDNQEAIDRATARTNALCDLCVIKWALDRWKKNGPPKWRD